jgi:cytochrome c-type biogenesis protein CcmH/NrfG
MTGALWPSALVAALFAIHPLHVQSVAWISERKDILSGLFFALTLAAYHAYARRPGPGRYLSVLLIFALGLLAKQMLVTVPLVLLLLDFWPLGRLFPRGVSPLPPAGRRAAVLRLAVEKLPLVLLGAGALIPVFHASGGVVVAGRAIRPMIYPLSVKLVNSFVSYPFYVCKMLWPVQLSILYPHPRTYFPVWMVAAGVLTLLVVSILGLRAARRQPWLLTGWFWYVAMLAPVAGAVQIGDHVVADRYSYLPLVGLFTAIAWGGAAYLRRRPGAGRVLLPAAAVAVLVLSALARREVGYWRDSLTIFGRAIEVTAGNYIALDQVGMAYAALGRKTEAIEKFRESIAAFPWRSSAHYNLGSLLGVNGRTLEAIDALRTAILINPGEVLAHNNLGAAYIDLGRPREALVSVETALRLDPGLAEAHFNKGRALLLLGDRAAATEEVEALRQLDGRLAGELRELIGRK